MPKATGNESGGTKITTQKSPVPLSTVFLNKKITYFGYFTQNMKLNLFCTILIIFLKIVFCISEGTLRLPISF